MKDYLTKRSIPGWIFGRKNKPNSRNPHEEKILKGFEKLPVVCRKLSPVLEIRYNPSDVTQTFALKKGGVEMGMVSVYAYTSGIFEDMTMGQTMEADTILKTSCFYVDWNESGRNWDPIIPLDDLDKDQLTYNIDRMNEFVSAFEV